MKKIHIKGFAEKIDICDKFSDNYNLGAQFCYEEESVDVIKNVFLRIYDSSEKTTLDEAIKGHIRSISGDMSLTGQEYGYSEVTIEGFDVTSAKIGGHDIQKIIDSKKGKYLHILIGQVKKAK